jgi:hypothetical protein
LREEVESLYVTGSISCLCRLDMTSLFKVSKYGEIMTSHLDEISGRESGDGEAEKDKINKDMEDVGKED